MAFQTRRVGVWPFQPQAIATISVTLDASAEKCAAVFRVGKAGDIHKIHFYVESNSGTQDVRASLQDVSLTDGHPDGTADQSGTVSVSSTGWKTVTLGADRTVAVDDLLAAVVDFNSYTSGNINVAAGNTPEWLHTYVDHFTAAWAKQDRVPTVALEYSDGSFGETLGLFSVRIGDVTIQTGTTPDEVAARFRLPFPVQVAGLACLTRAIAGTPQMILYNDASSALATAAAQDPDTLRSTSGWTAFRFSSSISLTANTWYRAAFKPTTAADVRPVYGDAVSAAALDQMPGGQDFYWSQRTDAGSWTDTTTRRPMIALLLDAFDDGTGGAGGGLLRPVGLAGGLT